MTNVIDGERQSWGVLTNRDLAMRVESCLPSRLELLSMTIETELNFLKQDAKI